MSKRRANQPLGDERQIPLRFAPSDEGIAAIVPFVVDDDVREQTLKADPEKLDLERYIGRELQRVWPRLGGTGKRCELSLLEPVVNRHRAIAPDDVEHRTTGAV